MKQLPPAIRSDALAAVQRRYLINADGITVENARLEDAARVLQGSFGHGPFVDLALMRPNNIRRCTSALGLAPMTSPYHWIKGSRCVA